MSNCKWCGTEFHAVEIIQHYCSKPCAIEARKYHEQQRYIKAHGALEARDCVHCGESFMPKRRDTRFCSKLCNAHFLEDNPTGYISDPDKWAVTTPYGGHSFDWWVKCSLEGSGAVSHV